jgi:hypothetical protein
METLRWVKCPTETSKRGTVPIIRKTPIASGGPHMVHVTCFRRPGRMFLWWVAVSPRKDGDARQGAHGRPAHAAPGAPDIAVLRQDARFPGSVYGTSGFRGSVYGYRVGSPRHGHLAYLLPGNRQGRKKGVCWAGGSGRRGESWTSNGIRPRAATITVREPEQLMAPAHNYEM